MFIRLRAEVDSAATSPRHGEKQAPHFFREIAANITLRQCHGSKRFAVLVAPFFSKCVHSCLNQKEGKPNQPLCLRDDRRSGDDACSKLLADGRRDETETQHSRVESCTECSTHSRFVQAEKRGCAGERACLPNRTTDKNFDVQDLTRKPRRGLRPSEHEFDESRKQPGQQTEQRPTRRS